MRVENRVSLTFIVICLVASLAHAQTTQEMAARRALIAEAEEARKGGAHERALSLAARAGQIRMTPSLRLFIAQEQYEVRQFANSLTNAELCIAEAEENKALNNRDNILRASRQLIGDLKQNAASVIVYMPISVPAGAQVTVAGHVVPETIYGKPYLVEPGKVNVDATAPGCQPFHQELTSVAGSEVALTVFLAPVPVQPVETKPQPSVTVKERIPSPEPVAPEKSTLRRVGPYATLGLGAAGLGASLVFLVLQNKAVSDLEANCDGSGHTHCPDRPEIRALRDTAARDNTLSKVSLAVGSAAVVSGALWLFLDKKGDSDHAGSARIQVVPAPGGALVGIGGKF